MRYIYKITNLIDGKVYIGQHKWNGVGLDPNYFCSSGNKHFWNAVKKYGIINFKKELVQKCYSDTALDIMEKMWIKYYRRVLGWDQVYNISDGGTGGYLSEEIHEKRLMTIASKYNGDRAGQFHTKEAVEKATKTMAANGHPRGYSYHLPGVQDKVKETNRIRGNGDPYYMIHTDEVRKKIYESELESGELERFRLAGSATHSEMWIFTRDGKYYKHSYAWRGWRKYGYTRLYKFEDAPEEIKLLFT